MKTPGPLDFVMQAASLNAASAKQVMIKVAEDAVINEPTKYVSTSIGQPRLIVELSSDNTILSTTKITYPTSSVMCIDKTYTLTEEEETEVLSYV